MHLVALLLALLFVGAVAAAPKGTIFAATDGGEQGSDG